MRDQRKANLTVPSDSTGQNRKFAESVKENLDVLLGHRGDNLDKAVTFRDLFSAGVASPPESIIWDGDAANITPAQEVPNLEIPPAPTNLVATSAFQNIFLRWDLLLYGGHAFTEIWSHSSDVISSATMLARVSGFTGVFSDPVGGGVTRYYWIRAINQNGVAGSFNSSTGISATTQTDTAVLIDNLTAEITSTELALALSTPIGNLPVNTTAEISSLQTQINTLNTVAAWASTDTYALDDLVTYSGNLYRSKSANNVGSQPSGNTSDTTDWEFVGTYSSLSAAVAGNTSDITEINFIDAASSSAIAARTASLSTTVAGHTTSIGTQATSINGLEAQYTVKIDNNGHISGFGLASTTAGSIPTSDFFVKADTFAVLPPAVVSNVAPTTNLYVGKVWRNATNNTVNYWNGTAWVTSLPSTVVPFIVKTTGSTVNGVSVPAGVYIRDAFIEDASITSAKIRDLNADKITAGLISADRIDAGSIKADKLALGGSDLLSLNINNTPTLIIGASRITNAKISNASVTTLKIGANQVTIPVAVVTTPNAVGNGQFTQQASVTLTTTVASDILVNWSCEQGYGSGLTGHGHKVQVYAPNGQTVNGPQYITNRAAAYMDNPADYLSGSGKITQSSAGSTTIYLYWAGRNNKTTLGKASISAIACQR